MDNDKLSEAINIGQEGLNKYSKKEYKICKQKCLMACEQLQKLLQQAKGENRKQLIKGYIKRYLTGAQNADAMLKNGAPIHTNENLNNQTVKFGFPVMPAQRESLPVKLPVQQNEFHRKVYQNMLDVDKSVHFNDIVGLQNIKKILIETIINPSLRPDLYKGVRSPPRGLLFFGPPGNGKTMLAKAVASQCKSTFFNVSAASLVSKWVGDSERMLKALFECAYAKQPSIIFIDEIDSILTKRSQNQNQASRRLKTQFLLQLDGVTTKDQDRVLVIGATNLPNELDKAALRRFSKKILIDMPDFIARKSMITKLLKNVKFTLSDKQITEVAYKLDMYSASDIKNIIKEAAMMPVRQLSYETLLKIDKEQLRPVLKKDFDYSIKLNPPTLSKKQYQKYKKFGNQFDLKKNDKSEKVGLQAKSDQQNIPSNTLDSQKQGFTEQLEYKVNQNNLQYFKETSNKEVIQSPIKRRATEATLKFIKQEQLVQMPISTPWHRRAFTYLKNKFIGR